MHYIKLFEDYSLYSDTSEEEFNKSPVIVISKSTRDLLSSIKNFEVDIRTYRVEIQGKTYYDEWTIFESEDEWYYIKKKVKDIMSGPYNDYFNYYKCDQLDGLKKFLEDYEIY